MKWIGPRLEEMRAWLTANGINPSDVPTDADMTIDKGPTGRVLRCEVFDRDSEGRVKLDERGDGPARLVINVPLKAEPPDWWQPYQKPTRDELLAVLKSVQELADEKGDMNRYISRERLQAVLALAYERETGHRD